MCHVLDGYAHRPQRKKNQMIVFGRPARPRRHRPRMWLYYVVAKRKKSSLV